MRRKCGIISIIGRSNVGKSTIFNSLVGKKISIITKKINTTRSKILGIKTDENVQMIFIDTPGIYSDKKSVENILQTIHLLDPPGVGARNLQECLSIQLKRKKSSQSVDTAIKIIDNNFDMFIKKHYKKIILKLNINEEILKKAIKEIEKLNPKPGAAFSETTKINSSIIPDFKVEIIENKLNLTLNSRNAPELHVSNEYKNMLTGYKETNKVSKKHYVQSLRENGGTNI